jgi:hypothetical protein
LNASYERVWLVMYGTNGSDPDSYVEHWLASKDFEIVNQWFGDVRLAAFAVPSTQPPAGRAADATFGGFAHLSGYTLTPAQVPSGDVLQLGLKWQATGQTPGNQKVFTHVIDAQGNIWAQRDSDPAGGARPTGGWKSGDKIDDNYGLLVVPGTPPGGYQLEVGMYDPANPAKRQPLTAGGSGDRLILGGVQVTSAPQPPSVDELHIPHQMEWSFGPIKLLGWGLTLVGQDVERTDFRAGDEVHLTLFWQADSQPASDQLVSLALAGRTLTSGTLLPDHPTSTWLPGERSRNQYRLTMPADLRGDADLVLSVDGAPPVTITRAQLH